MPIQNNTTKYIHHKSNYDKFPSIWVSPDSQICIVGWDCILERLHEAIQQIQKKRKVIVIETYHGVFIDQIIDQLKRLSHQSIISTSDVFKTEAAIDLMLGPTLGNHPVFGYLSDIEMIEFLDSDRLSRVIGELASLHTGTIFIVGPGATLISPDWDLLLYADLARWEIQQRMRDLKIGNMGSHNLATSLSQKYKRGYFVDWRVCDRLKRRLLNQWDFVLDTHEQEHPKLIEAEWVRRGLQVAVKQPFRLVPFFDPGVWGGQWMREVCNLSPEPPNFAWCFDCVPEENSLYLTFGSIQIEIPAINLVFAHPQELLGERVYQQFGAEFPIRFDFLDTMDGGNLSLQVHPVKAYMREHFGLSYTQDESYYLLDAKEDAVVYLGQHDGIDPNDMIHDLEQAQRSGDHFPVDKYIQSWPVKKHDHILIPAGTVHCSGKNSMVLEISATPYIFTFKLWDWGRLDLDGKPRPISLEHGKRVIQWDRTKSWVEKELINCIEPVAEGDGWREERTGLHSLEFIETRRHWFTKTVAHHTEGNLNVINLVQGNEVVVESPTHTFEPFIVHYAETFIIPAEVGPYTIRPTVELVTEEYATVKAYVR